MALIKCSLRIFGLNNYHLLKHIISPIQLCSVFCSTKNDAKNAKSLVISHPYSVKKLQDLFNIKKSVAVNIILENKNFSEVSVKEFVQVFKTCIDAGIKKEHLLQHVNILTTSEVEEKLEILKKLPHELNTTFPLLVHSKRLLNNFVKEEETEKRIKFLSKLFHVYNKCWYLYLFCHYTLLF